MSGVRVLASCSLAHTANSSVSWSGWLQLKVGSLATCSYDSIVWLGRPFIGLFFVQ